MKNRKVILEKRFKVNGTFKSKYAAESWLTKNGYEYGSTCIGYPIAIVKGKYDLPFKMKNFTHEQIDSIDGIMFGEFREGEVTIQLYK